MFISSFRNGALGFNFPAQKKKLHIDTNELNINTRDLLSFNMKRKKRIIRHSKTTEKKKNERRFFLSYKHIVSTLKRNHPERQREKK